MFAQKDGHDDDSDQYQDSNDGSLREKTGRFHIAVREPIEYTIEGREEPVQ